MTRKRKTNDDDGDAEVVMGVVVPLDEEVNLDGSDGLSQGSLMPSLDPRFQIFFCRKIQYSQFTIHQKVL
jgi:hypothetical protein